VITDARMPVMGALEMLQVLRSDVVYQELPVIVVTGEVFSSEKEEILAAGAMGCLTKPVQNADLYKLISEQLAAKSININVPALVCVSSQP
jgi:CheY-like chemotaxis protein